MTDRISEPAAEPTAQPNPGPPEALADRLPYRIVRAYRVRFEESTPNETMRSAIHLAWIADVAWQHSALLGFGRDWYSSRGLFWLVRAIRLDVLAPLATYQQAFVNTQVTGYRRIGARRESEVRDELGRLLARAEIDWVMINDRGVPTRVPDEFLEFVVDGGVAYEMHKVALPVAPAHAFEGRFHVRRRDLDPLDHVNNSVYLDYFEEALTAAGQAELLTALPRRYTLEFVSSAARAEALVARIWPDDGGWNCRLSRVDGSDILRARLERLG
jgi:medium-chain acyl-[acyl-carrier-protein] hydrolase